MSVTFKTSSGAEVVVNVADMDAAFDLHDAVFSEAALGKLDMNFDFMKGKSFNEIEVSDILNVAFRDAMPIVMRLAASKEVRAALFACFLKCTYNGEKITKNTFSAEDARGDYYEIVWEVMKANLSPFFKKLVSKLNSMKEILSKSPKSQG